MRTRDLKFLAEESQGEYEEYVTDCKSNNSNPVDIWSWLSEQIATEEEYRNEYLRIDFKE